MVCGSDRIRVRLAHRAVASADISWAARCSPVRSATTWTPRRGPRRHRRPGPGLRRRPRPPPRPHRRRPGLYRRPPRQLPPPRARPGLLTRHGLPHRPARHPGKQRGALLVEGTWSCPAMPPRSSTQPLTTAPGPSPKISTPPGRAKVPDAPADPPRACRQTAITIAPTRRQAPPGPALRLARLAGPLRHPPQHHRGPQRIRERPSPRSTRPARPPASQPPGHHPALRNRQTRPPRAAPKRQTTPQQSKAPHRVSQ